MKEKNESVIWKTVTVRLTQEEKETLRKIAEAEDLPLTIWVRRLLRRLIKVRTQKPESTMVRTADGKEFFVPLDPYPDSTGDPYPDSTGGKP